MSKNQTVACKTTCLRAYVDSEGLDQTARPQDLHCPLTESLDTTEFMNGEQTGPNDSLRMRRII